MIYNNLCNKNTNNIYIIITNFKKIFIKYIIILKNKNFKYNAKYIYIILL